jgi:hypothetical protein
VKKWHWYLLAGLFANFSQGMVCAQAGETAGESAAQPADWATPLRRIALNSDGTIYLSLGGQLRERFEYYNEPFFGVRGVHEDDYLLHRLLLSADLHVGDHFRFFLEFGNHLEAGKEAPRSPTDVDEFDVQQAFLDLSIPFDAQTKLTLRGGRHEMSFGSSRLVGIREGPNVRRSFDGGRLTFSNETATFDAFLVRTVRLQVGAFNDEPEPDETFWGFYGVIPVSVLPDGHFDFYYLGLERDEATFQQGVADEHRHSFGIRVWGTPGPWDYNCEAVIQTGSFGNADILAWTFASDTGYTFASVLFTPRVGIKADIASGDSDPSNGWLNTFNALFPKQPYFSEASLLAPANLIDLHPSASFSFTKAVTLTTDIDFFWKHEVDDAIYAPPGRPLIPGGLSNSHYIGSQVNAEVEWEINRYVSVTFYYSHFFAGSAVTGAGGRDVDFAGSWINFRF